MLALSASQGLISVTTTVLFANFTAVSNVDALTNVVIVVFLSELDEKVRTSSQRGKRRVNPPALSQMFELLAALRLHPTFRKSQPVMLTVESRWA